MVTTVSNWSSTPASNNAAPPVGAPEDMTASNVNNVMREMMAALRSECYNDTTWTATVTGMTGSVTGTARYFKLGNLVVVYLPAMTGTSNTTACTITGMPSAIFPARNQGMLCPITDNSVKAHGWAVIGTGGTITLSPSALLGAWTNVLTKGVQECVLIYSIN